ncbi:hypothetical protein FRC17_002623 [Serendipita sp. 399]|nr:hypothetical protein FRC17_002623 [Serendipita sp. 399]
MGYIEAGKKEGATVHVGGDRHGDEGYYVQPTVFTDATPDMKIVKEEIFGPVVVISKFEDEEDIIHQANNSMYGLAAAVFSKDITRALTVANRLQAGTVWLPFGGYKASGFGRELGEYALQNFTNVKAVHVNLGHRTASRPMPSDYAPLSVDSENPSTSKFFDNGGVLVVHPQTGEYVYQFGPSGLKGLLHTKYAVFCSLFASIGGMTFGYDQGVISNILVMRDFMHRFPLSPFQTGLLTAVLELGALFGALEAGIFADKYSRRHSIILASDLRGMLCPLYISEMASPETRGSFISLEQFSIVFGVVLGFWAGFLTRSFDGSSSWRIPLGIQILPGIILAIGTLWLPPSPRLLVLRRKEEKALQTLVKLRDRDEGDPLVQLELAEMRVEAKLATEAGGEHGSRWRDLFGPTLIRRTMIGVGVMFFQQWSGINALLYYGPSLMRSIGLEGDTVSLVMSGFINIMQLVAVIPAIFLLDSVGRKPLLQIGALVMSGSHIAVAIIIWLGSENWAAHRGLAWVAVGMIYLFTAAYGVSFGPVAWVLPTEVFPLSLRSKGAAISTASNWFNNCEYSIFFFSEFPRPLVILTGLYSSDWPCHTIIGTSQPSWDIFSIGICMCCCFYLVSTRRSGNKRGIIRGN